MVTLEVRTLIVWGIKGFVRPRINVDVSGVETKNHAGTSSPLALSHRRRSSCVLPSLRASHLQLLMGD